MKKTIFFLSALLCWAVTTTVFTSCISNEDNPTPAPTPTPTPKVVDLGTLTDAYTALDGQTLTGTLARVVQITVAPGASITLEDVSINAEGEVYQDNPFAGITCLGDATITLSGDNVIRGFSNFYPAIFVPEGYTLTIQGDGSLDVKGSGYYNIMCAAIGSVRAGAPCGNLVFLGGKIYAEGGRYCAAIGASYASVCGDITIGGTAEITVNSNDGAGIGTGSGPYENMSICGDITIGGQAKVEAIGLPAIGAYYVAKCGNITIGEDADVVAEGVDIAPGIGCGSSYTWCKEITISGGHDIASCEEYGPGIGTSCGDYSICDGITITGGTILAIGGEDGPGIGSGPESEFGVPIVITSGATEVTTIRGSYEADFIGTGAYGTRGSVTIDGVEDATPESTFTHFESFSFEYRWTILNKSAIY